MILERTVHPDGSASFDGSGFHLAKLHEKSPECSEYGCVVHAPTMTAPANIEGWPYNWREDRGIMERLCRHDVGHPDPDAADYLARRGHEVENVHGCCGCPCGKEYR